MNQKLSKTNKRLDINSSLFIAENKKRYAEIKKKIEKRDMYFYYKAGKTLERNYKRR